MIVLFTDFGLEGPYTGQVNAVLQESAPGVPVIQLFADAPAGQPKPAALGSPAAPRGYPDWPDDLAEIVYIDHYGNALTGLRGESVPLNARLSTGGHPIPHAETFSAVPPDEALWYVNSNGLVEIAVN